MLDPVESASAILEDAWKKVARRRKQEKRETNRHQLLWDAGVEGVPPPRDQSPRYFGAVNIFGEWHRDVVREAMFNAYRIAGELERGGKLIRATEVCPWCHTRLRGGKCDNMDCIKPLE